MKYQFSCALFILFLFQPMLGYSQFFVGDSRDFVITVLESINYEFTQDPLTDTTSRISWIIENDYQMILVLNTKDVVTRQTLIPESENGVNKFVKWFNEDFVIVSETEWRNYENGKIFTLELEYLLSEPYFSITLSPESKN